MPELIDPVMIAAFEGWNDAGDAATTAVEHLDGGLGRASRSPTLDPEDYYDFQVNRPTVSHATTATREITWPTTRLSVARVAGAEAA